MSTHSYIALSDDQIYNLCKRYGAQARLWRQKFAGLLPEVYKRHLYKKKGFGSIFEFAAKLAGMSKDQVSRVLNLDEAFEDKPVLKAMLEKGEVSVNKLARIASVATSENEEFWAQQVKVLPKSALETLVRDEKFSSAEKHEEPVPGHNFSDKDLQLLPEVKKKLLELQQKGIDINAFILESLEKREQEIVDEKNEIASKMTANRSRHIPVQIENILTKEYGTKCAIPNCEMQAEEIHHTERYSISKTHNPFFLAPLCKNHHVIAHSIDVKFTEARIGYN